ncbi:MAG: hypothetical protein ACRDOA_21485 [Streptosporangiaceae bacterium]
MDQRYPSSGQSAGPAWSALGIRHRGTGPSAVPPDPGCYEERYQVAGVALRLAAGPLVLGLLAAVLGTVWRAQLIFSAFPALLAIPAVLTMALRPVAFRADHAGVTLGAVRVLPPRPAVFIPWADIEKIILYPAGSGKNRVECVGVQRREGAPALPYGNERAPDCPVGGVAAGAARRMTHWRLDRARLGAATLAVAPGIPIIETKYDPAWRIGQLARPLGRPPRPM